MMRFRVAVTSRRVLLTVALLGCIVVPRAVGAVGASISAGHRPAARLIHTAGISTRAGVALPIASAARKVSSDRSLGVTRAARPAALTSAAPSAGVTLGYTQVGGTQDSCDADNMNGSKVTTGAGGGQVTSMSAYVGQIDPDPTKDQFQTAIYADDNGSPGALAASSVTGTLVANSWNTVAISASLSPNTTYWLMYNTNTSDCNANELYYDDGPAGSGAYANAPFGAWPDRYDTYSSVAGGDWLFSLYATLVGGATATPSATPTAMSTDTPTAPAVTTPTATPTATTTTGTPPSSTTITVDDSARGQGLDRVTYSGLGWRHCAGCTPPVGPGGPGGAAAYDNTYSQDNTANDLVTMTFTGTGITLYGAVTLQGGIGAVSITDASGGTEVAETPVDFYPVSTGGVTPTLGGDQVIYRSPALANGLHVVMLRVTKTHDVGSTDYDVYLDRVDITRPGP